MRLRSTEEQEEIVENIQNVFMRLFQCKLTENTSFTKTSLWIQSARCLSQSTTSAERTSKEQPRIPVTSGRACVEHNAGLRKTNAALCRGKHNTALFYNPNQDARMAGSAGRLSVFVER